MKQKRILVQVLACALMSGAVFAGDGSVVSAEVCSRLPEPAPQREHTVAAPVHCFARVFIEQPAILQLSRNLVGCVKSYVTLERSPRREGIIAAAPNLLDFMNRQFAELHQAIGLLERGLCERGYSEPEAKRVVGNYCNPVIQLFNAAGEFVQLPTMMAKAARLEKAIRWFLDSMHRCPCGKRLPSSSGIELLIAILREWQFPYLPADGAPVLPETITS